MSRDELLTLENLKSDRLFRFLFALFGPILVLALGCVLAFFFDKGEWIALAGTAAMWFAVVLRPWRTVPIYLNQFASLGVDEDNGEVLLCAGSGRDLIFTMSAEQRLEPALLVTGSHDQRLEIVVGEQSRAIFTVNGVAVDRWSQVAAGHTAAQSDHSRLAAQFVSPHPNLDNAGIGARTLTPEELAEIARHSMPLAFVDLALFFGFLAVASVSWWRVFATKAPTLLLPFLSTIVFTIVAVRSLRRWTIHRRFAADVALGRVAIVSLESGNTVIEYLPFSGYVWSENHVAAPWRRLPLVRGTFARRMGP
jgi:hypothetical protein